MMIAGRLIMGAGEKSEPPRGVRKPREGGGGSLWGPPERIRNLHCPRPRPGLSLSPCLALGRPADNNTNLGLSLNSISGYGRPICFGCRSGRPKPERGHPPAGAHD